MAPSSGLSGEDVVSTYPDGCAGTALVLGTTLLLRWRWRKEVSALPMSMRKSCRSLTYVAFTKPCESPGTAVTSVVSLVVVVNICAFLLSTCNELSEQYPWFDQVLEELSRACTFLFTVEYIIRLWAAAESPRGRLHWMTTDVLGLLDLVSILPEYVQEFTAVDHQLINFSWLRLFRAFHVLASSSFAPDLADFTSLMKTQVNKVMAVSLFVTGTMWLLCSALYYYFDHDNPDMVICPACKDIDDPSSCSRDLKDSCYNRMESIPSAMYFCLVNLFGEFPLMSRHAGGSRFVCIFVAFIGQVVMGIPCSLLGGAFQEHVQQVATNQVSSAVEDGNPRSSKVACGYLSQGAMVAAHSIPSITEAHPEQERLLKILSGKRGEMRDTIFGELDLGEAYQLVMFTLTFASVMRFLTFPAWAMHEHLEGLLLLLDVGSVVACFVDFRCRFRYAQVVERRRSRYVWSFWGMLDLAAWVVPVVLSPLAILYEYVGLSLVLQSFAAVAKLLKLERFIGGFKVFGRLLRANKHVLWTTGLVALVAWVFCSVAMYASERWNPNWEVRKYYTSIPSAMWLTMLNLTGECPVVDYLLPGRWITGIMGLVGVGFFTVPFGLMSGGFEGYLEEEAVESAAEGSAEASETQATRVVVTVPFSYMQQWIMRLLCIAPTQVPSKASQIFKFLSVTCTLLTVAQSLWRSVPGALGSPHSRLATMDRSLESSCMIFFTAEFFLRIYVAPSTPGLWSRRRYILSFYGIVDMLIVVPYYLARSCHQSRRPMIRLMAFMADRHDEEFRLLRVLRLGLLDNYVPSLRLIRRVLRNPVVNIELSKATYVGVTIWFTAACLLSLTESWDPAEPEQRDRFGTALSAMPFTLVHLTGDYPLIDYTVPAKVVHLMMLALMSGFVAVPAGILANGFQQELKLEREAERAMRRGDSQGDTGAGEAPEAAPAAAPAAVATSRTSNANQLQVRLAALLRRRAASRLRVLLTSVGVVAVMLLSMPRFSSWSWLHQAQVVVSSAFTLDYLLQLYAAPANKKCKFSRWSFAFSSVGIVDVVSFGPYWLEIALKWAGVATVTHLDIFFLARVLTILQLETLTGGFRLLSETLAKCGDTMAASGILAVLIWLVSAVIFHELEGENEKLEGAFESIPNSLYYTAVFLADEWAVVDFTPIGQVLMVFMCAISIGLAALPVGSLFEAFADALQDSEEQDDDEESKKA